MNSSDALSYYNQIKNSFSGEAVAPGAVPQGFVANLAGTAIHAKGTFLGRFWRVFHLIARTEKSSMQSAIRKIDDFARSQFETDKMKAESTLQDLAENGCLNERWTRYTVEEVKEAYQDANRFLSLWNVFNWAHGKENIVIDEKSKENLDQAIAFEQGWHRYTTAVPISLLARELRTDYSQEAIETRRGDCPAYVLYAPLVAIAVQLEDVPKSSFKEVREFFNGVVPGNATGDLILEIAGHLHTPEAANNLPNDLVEVLKDLEWVTGCNLEKNYSLPITTQTELQKVTVEASVSVFGCGNTVKTELPTQVTHTTNYCYQRFPEKITIVDRYPYLSRELSCKK